MNLALALLALSLHQGGADSTVYNGRAKQLDVRIPRTEADVTIDGVLDEPVWRRAAVLTGFSLYSPVDQRPAPDSTEVLVWYSPSAIHFGVRAFEPHGSVRATLAERDRVSSDDNVEIQLDTYADRKRAFVFIVNPLGVQADGTKSEGGGFIPGANIMPGMNDLSADFRWQSRGRLTDTGYEIELRIPFSSLRFPDGGTQHWGIQVVRRIQHSGYELTWTPARKGSASFIAQEGFLRGLTGMEHGLVVEVNPELVNTTLGSPRPTGPDAGSWRYDNNVALGGNVKWGLGSNFVLNGAVKPDFSQVEADALQIAGDARFALFYAERRPFFVEGSEQFNVPNTLVYTRTIAHPTAAAKVTGKIADTELALLTASDDPEAWRLAPGERPFVGILRVKRDFATQSTAGIILSDREEGPAFNRLAGADVRHVFGGMYFMQFQAVASSTRLPGAETRTSPLWEAVVDRTGRYFGFHYSILGVGEDFIQTNGFVPRRNYVSPNIANRFTWLGKQGALLERYNVFLRTDGIWRYDGFFRGESMLEGEAQANNGFTLRGGWSVDVNPSVKTYRFDPADYAGLYVHDPVSSDPNDFIPFEPTDRLSTVGIGFGVNTPQFRRFSASADVDVGNDVDFFETSRVRRFDARASVDWRPTEKIRVNGSYASNRFTSRDDGRLLTSTRIPRLKLEYQVSRPIFVRFVGQYQALRDEPLIDPRTGSGIHTLSDGVYLPATRFGRTAGATNDFRVDWLFSYRPNPGTVFFAGYGSTLTEPRALRFQGLERRTDGFFVKASYLFRVNQ